VDWGKGRISGPDGEDWRVPVYELIERQKKVSSRLAIEGVESAFIDDPVELYWLTGSRQDSAFLIGADGSEIQNTHWIRKSLDRAKFESGGEDCPHLAEEHPRMGDLFDSLKNIGCTMMPCTLEKKIPHNRWRFLRSKMGGFSNDSTDCTDWIYELREVKSDWEKEMIRESGEINLSMFEEIQNFGGLGKTELEIAGAAEQVSRSAGFGGRIRMRRWPMDCDRVVITSGKSGSVPTFFDSAIGGYGSSPISPLGAGFTKVMEKDPVLVDIVHVHRGYVSDCTRMFCAGNLPEEWSNRLEDMIEISNAVVNSLAKGDFCSDAWNVGSEIANEMGHSKHLMGMAPHQAKFLGHSVGLELDETPVVADGFERSLELGGTMAVEPKIIFENGAIGIEDTWIRCNDGIECLTAGNRFPAISEWQT